MNETEPEKKSSKNLANNLSYSTKNPEKYCSEKDQIMTKQKDQTPTSTVALAAKTWHSLSAAPVNHTINYEKRNKIQVQLPLDQKVYAYDSISSSS